MSPESVFQIASALAMIGWLVLLIASPFWLNIDSFLIGIVVALLCLVYAWMIIAYFDFSGLGKFGSLDGVMGLFTDKAIVTAGWVHYLAFDLLTGVWIKRNSVNYNLPHLIMIPCLLLTFMLGPVGLLLYLLIRWIRFRQYFAPNY